MTSAPVNEVSRISMYKAGQGFDKGTAGQAEKSTESFQDAMSQAKNNQSDKILTGPSKSTVTSSNTRIVDPVSNSGAAQKNNSVKQPENTGKTEEAVKAENPSKAEDVKEEKPVEETEDVKETVDETAEEVEKEVVKEVADALDVTEEEVAKAMETLGLTVMDLLNPSNMAALVSELTGGEDPMAVLTDENLFSMVQDLTAEVAEIIDGNIKDLAKDLGMDEQELLNMLEASLKEPADGENLDKAPVVVEVDKVSGQEAAKEQVVNEEKTGDEFLEEKALGKVSDENAVFNKSAGQDQGMMHSGQESSPLVNQMFAPDFAAAGEVQNTELPFTSYMNTQDIIDQIADYVKIHQSEGMSEMEISLNPESLGHIRLQVASREGVITAAITTENEAVRQALMVQAMTLKEELNEQGLKVEAVEVTVASHEFERDMKDGGEEARNLFEKQIHKQTRRRLVIDDLAQAEEMLADEDLTDAERLQIDMMAKSGNSVDFTA